MTLEFATPPPTTILPTTILGARLLQWFAPRKKSGTEQGREAGLCWCLLTATPSSDGKDLKDIKGLFKSNAVRERLFTSYFRMEAKYELTIHQHNNIVVSVAIPPLQPDGLLPPGVHRCTWAELEGRFGASAYRSSLLCGLLESARMLALAGCGAIYIDGSFVTEKPFPGDFDACWETAGVDPHLLDPVFFNFSNRRAAQKARFRGELFLANSISAPGVTFLDFFQKDKNTGMPKGIVLLDLGSLPA